MIKIKWLVLLTVLLMVGCAKMTSGLRIEGETQRVLIGDKVLASRLEVMDISTTQVNDHARGVVRLLSHHKAEQQLQYRFYWYDDAGLDVSAQLAPWKLFIIQGNEEVALSEVAVNPKATQFRIQIRELN